MACSKLDIILWRWKNQFKLVDSCFQINEHIWYDNLSRGLEQNHYRELSVWKFHGNWGMASKNQIDVCTISDSVWVKSMSEWRRILILSQKIEEMFTVFTTFYLKGPGFECKSRLISTKGEKSAGCNGRDCTLPSNDRRLYPSLWGLDS